MRGQVAALVAGLLIIFSGAIQLIDRASPAVVGLGIHRKAVQNPVKRDALRRRQTVTETLDNEETLYYANITLGTPSQNLRLHIDTGSSDMWVNVKSSEICEYRGSPCSDSGTYDANASSTYKFVNNDFNVSYVDGSGASGDYATDNIGIGGRTLTALQFGIGYISTTAEGILGIGYTADESQVNTARLKSYANLPEAMVNGGMIQSNAYSLWLDDLEASTGSILFGGVDTGKYAGQLETVPIQQEYDQYAEFIITLSSMSLQNGARNTTLTTDLPTAVILDSGSSLIYLPNELTSDIYQALNLQYSEREGAAFGSCNLANENITLDFTFTSPTISVPISELIINPDTSTSEDRDNSDSGSGNGSSNSEPSSEESACIFGIAPAEGSTAVLGDTFLRSAYVVYDLANNEISLAQTNFNSTISHVSEIGTGSSSVPDATKVSNAIQASVSQGGGSRIAAVTGGSETTSINVAASAQVPFKALTALATLAVVFTLT